MAHKLTHPDSDQEIEVGTEQVALYTSQGWQAKSDAKPSTSDATTTSEKAK